MSATPRTHNADGQRARGRSNGNERGNTETRRRRREFLLETYAADVKLVRITYANDTSEPTYMPPHIAGALGYVVVEDGLPLFPTGIASVALVPTARCFHCGTLLHDGTITVDRIIPGCRGGTYHRNNIRPACSTHNSSLGGALRQKRR